MRKAFALAAIVVAANLYAGSTTISHRSLGTVSTITYSPHPFGSRGDSHFVVAGQHAWIFWRNHIPARSIVASILETDGRPEKPVGTPVTSGGIEGYVATADRGKARVYWIGESQPRSILSRTIDIEGRLSTVQTVAEVESDPSPRRLSGATSGAKTFLLFGRFGFVVDATEVVSVVVLEDDGWTVAAAHKGTFLLARMVDGRAFVTGIDSRGERVGPAEGVPLAEGGSSFEMASSHDALIALTFTSQETAEVLSVDPETLTATLVARMDDLPLGIRGRTRLIAIDGTFVAVWTQGRAIEGAWLSEGTEDRLVFVSEGSFQAVDDLVIWNGRLHVAYQSPSCLGRYCRINVWITMVDEIGTPSERHHLVSAAATQQSMPAIATDGRGFLVAWQEPPNRIAYVISALDRPAMQTTIDGLSDYRTAPAVTWGNGVYTLAWGGWSSEFRSPALQVRTLGINGTIVRERSIPVSSSIRRVRVVASSGQVLVVWADGDSLHAERLDSNGRRLDAAPLFVAEETRDFEVAFDGQDYLLVYQQYDSETGTYAMDTSRVTRSGQAAFDRTLREAADALSNPSLACSSESCLVLWSHLGQNADEPDSVEALYLAARTSNSLSPVFTVEASSDDAFYPNVGATEAGNIVTWVEWDGVSYTLRAARLTDRSREVVDPFSPIVVQEDVCWGRRAMACVARRCVEIAVIRTTGAIYGDSLRLLGFEMTERRPRGIRRH